MDKEELLEMIDRIESLIKKSQSLRNRDAVTVRNYWENIMLPKLWTVFKMRLSSQIEADEKIINRLLREEK